MFQDQPNESRCLGVFGLSIYTTERELHDVFIKYGPIDKVQVVVDAKVTLNTPVFQPIFTSIFSF